jgi:chemotaxis methyl-accepting protein methylase
VSIRIWIAACATGEVYSIAMLLLNSRPYKNNIPLQIFASDLN